MSMRFIGSLSLIWLFLATAALAQANDPVLDTTGQALQRGQEYYIKPAVTELGGRFTLIDRNSSCPLFVGQVGSQIGQIGRVGGENVTATEGLPVVFTPFEEGERVIRVNRDFSVAFSAFTTCAQSTTWKVGERDTETGRRLIVTGAVSEESPVWKAGSYFRIEECQSAGGGNIYNLAWCPTEVCPSCRLRCGAIGNLVENRKILSALDGNVLPVEFERA
ncbi:Kunitz type trypsin inhibitor [Quillaja saponaria]|uniref:Kunitz type trypsin inhibitor n=1 Tax=Quillaja saponaria TaxID=32244 RepID=A0AAD7KZQ0_QUISA|nr:Kunitz type trypsin inhibitor [Quillaja saponaria]